MAFSAVGICSCMLLLACTGSCAVPSSRRQVNVIKHNEILRDQEARELTGIKLPQFLAIGIKYSFARSWITKSTYKKQERDRFCDENQLQKIKVCGAEQLYTAIASGFSKLTLGQAKLTSGDFKRNLETLCREYDEYKRCLKESSVDECGAEEKSVVDILYSQMCFDGRQYLMSFDVGMCLSNLKMASVAKVVKATTGCEYYFTDMSTSVEAMFSAFHDHDEDEENESVAIRENLLILCRYWHNLEKCLLPAYGKLCGKSAETFYVGLVDKIKGILAETFKPYGSNVETIAKCSKTTGERATSMVRSGSSNKWLFRYIEKQRDTFTMAEKHQQLRCGPCSPLTTSCSLMACFWQVVYDISTKLVDILNQMPRDPNEMCRLLQLFQNCYDGHVSACPVTSKVDFSSVNRACGVINALNRSCVDALVDVQSSTRCGNTFSEITEYYLFNGLHVYLLDQTTCDDNPPIPSKLDLSCFDRNINSAARNASRERGPDSCVPHLKTFIHSLTHVTEQHRVLFGRARDAMCKRNCGLQ